MGENLNSVPKSKNAVILAERNDFSDVARLRFTNWEYNSGKRYIFGDLWRFARVL